MFDETVTRVTFIQPPSSLLLEDRIMPPLGILTMAAILRDRGHEVSVIDLAGVDDWKAELTRESNKLDCDWLGLTCTTPQYGVAKKISESIRIRGYDMPMVAGGMHITSETYANRTDFLNDGFDSYCTGEGFNSIQKMCDDIKTSGKLQKLYSEPIWPDVNTLPLAARDLVDIKSYKYKLGTHHASTIYSSYGCVYTCSFCESRMAGSYVIRNMTPQRIKAEVEEMRDRWGLTGIMDFSDELNLDRKRFLGICDMYRELPDVVWRGFLVAAKWDEEMARAAARSNCYQIATGIESFHPRILKNIMKPATPEINKQFVRTTKKAGLNLKVFMIVGLPGEDWSTIKATYDALNELRREGHAPDDLDVSILTVYHGSEIYKNRDRIDLEFKDYSDETDKMYYKSQAANYQQLIHVKTKGMSEYDLYSARNFLEYSFKKTNWMEDATGRKDLDRVYEKTDVAESIKHAEKQLGLSSTV